MAWCRGLAPVNGMDRPSVVSGYSSHMTVGQLTRRFVLKQCRLGHEEVETNVRLHVAVKTSSHYMYTYYQTAYLKFLLQISLKFRSKSMIYQARHVLHRSNYVQDSNIVGGERPGVAVR